MTNESLSSTGEVRLWKDEKEEAPLTIDSPHWMEIRLRDRDGHSTKAIPLNEGYFEFSIPKSFLEHNPQVLTLQWIDFYRQ